MTKFTVRTVRPLSVAASFLTLAALLLAPSLAAQSFGRIALTIVDPAGEPLGGVTIRATCPEIPRFEESTTTKKKGRATIAVVDATKSYDLEISLDGYQTLKTQVKPELGNTTFRELVLLPVDTAPQAAPAAPAGTAEAPAPAGEVARLTAAEKTFNEGITALREGDVAAAKTKFLAAVDQDDKLVPAHAALAGVYLEEKDYAAALASTDVLLALEPDSATGLRARYEAYQGLGQTREAKQALAKLSALGADGNAAAIVYNEGVSALRDGDLIRASASFEEALAIDPNLVAALTAYAAVRMDRKEYAEAAALAERALAVEPKQMRALRLRHDAYRAAGDEAKATEAFAALAAVDPTSLFQELYEKGIEQFNAGESANAKQNFERCIELDPEHAKVRYHLGLVLSSLGDTAGAKEQLSRFIALAPDDPDAGAARDMLTYLK